MELKLTLRAVTGYWTPARMTVYDNTELTFRLDEESRKQIKHKAVLLMNNAAFSFDAEGVVSIPANGLEEVNCGALQDVSESGNIANKWRIESLVLNKYSADKDSESYIASEREYFATVREELASMRLAVADVTKNQERTASAFAQEIVKQGKQLEEMRKDIAALKDEPLV